MASNFVSSVCAIVKELAARGKVFCCMLKGQTSYALQPNCACFATGYWTNLTQRRGTYTCSSQMTCSKADAAKHAQHFGWSLCVLVNANPS